jgi:hypothetical protein
MARNNDLTSLVAQFASDIETIVARKAAEAFAERFDAVKAQLLGGAPVRAARAAAPALVAHVVPAEPGHRKPGRPKGSKSRKAAELKACPVCGKMNKARRFSYLCEDHRNAENLAKFKGTAKTGVAAKAAPVKRGPGRPPKALPAAPAPVKRGPGRPPKAAKAAEGAAKAG